MTTTKKRGFQHRSPQKHRRHKSPSVASLPSPDVVPNGITRRQAIERNRCRWDGGRITAPVLDVACCCGRKVHGLGFCREHFKKVCEKVVDAASLLGRAR
jgi:hypothetical protein